MRPATLVRVCDECNYGSYAGRCVICGGIGVSDAYYCKECTIQEKDVRCMLALYLLPAAGDARCCISAPAWCAVFACRETAVQRS